MFSQGAVLNVHEIDKNTYKEQHQMNMNQWTRKRNGREIAWQ